MGLHGFVEILAKKLAPLFHSQNIVKIVIDRYKIVFISNNPGTIHHLWSGLNKWKRGQRK